MHACDGLIVFVSESGCIDDVIEYHGRGIDDGGGGLSPREYFFADEGSCIEDELCVEDGIFSSYGDEVSGTGSCSDEGDADEGFRIGRQRSVHLLSVGGIGN